MTHNLYKPPFAITSKIISLVGKISEVVAKIELSEHRAIAPALRKVNRIKTITGTLEIEGNSLGIKKITSIINGKTVLGSAKELAEVRGAIKAYENLDEFDYKNIDDLLRAHKLLMGELLTDAGNLRAKDVGVGNNKEIVHIAPPAIRIPQLMDDLFDWLRSSDIHPLIKSSVFHYELEFIHPFTDGNGRVGRLWQTLILYRWKEIFSMMPVESVIRDTGEKYYKALEISNDIGKDTPFVEFMLEAILLTCEGVLEESGDVPKDDPRNVPLKRLEHIIRLIGKDKSVTIEKMAKICGVSTKTIKRDIAKLKEQNRIKRVGSLKAGYWEIIDEK